LSVVATTGVVGAVEVVAVVVSSLEQAGSSRAAIIITVSPINIQYLFIIVLL
jgi:hypothetical protein